MTAFVALRNQILIEILLSNGCRAGGLLAIKHAHIMQLDDSDDAVQTISVHHIKAVIFYACLKNNTFISQSYYSHQNAVCFRSSTTKHLPPMVSSSLGWLISCQKNLKPLLWWSSTLAWQPRKTHRSLYLRMGVTSQTQDWRERLGVSSSKLEQSFLLPLTASATQCWPW